MQTHIEHENLLGQVFSRPQETRPQRLARLANLSSKLPWPLGQLKLTAKKTCSIQGDIVHPYWASRRQGAGGPRRPVLPRQPRLLAAHYCRDVDLEEHAGYSKATDHEERIGRDWTVAVYLPSTLRNIRLVANVRDVDHLLDCIRQ